MFKKGSRGVLNPAQIRAARGLLDWGQSALADAAGISVPSVKRAESPSARSPASPDLLARIKAALEAAGVIFVEENGEGPGVRLRKVP
jgi:transcriptional regulator with XRE-family HTH domain